MQVTAYKNRLHLTKIQQCFCVNFSCLETVSCKVYLSLSYIQQDLYEDVSYGVLTPQTKIKVKVNPSGEYISK
jgi:hypothetical protein